MNVTFKDYELFSTDSVFATQCEDNSDWEVYSPDALAAAYSYMMPYREWRKDRRRRDEDASLDKYAEMIVAMLRVDTDVLDIYDECDNLIGYAVKIF